MSFSHSGEIWLAETHGGGITSGMYAATNWTHATAPRSRYACAGEAYWALGIGGVVA